MTKMKGGDSGTRSILEITNMGSDDWNGRRWPRWKDIR